MACSQVLAEREEWCEIFVSYGIGRVLPKFQNHCQIIYSLSIFTTEPGKNLR